MNASKRICIFAAAIALSGCASFGPFGGPEFEPALRRDVPSITTQLLFSAPATLLYGVNGYEILSNVAARVPVMANSHRTSGQGVVVVSENKIHFVHWHQQKYSAEWSADIKNVRSVGVRSLGLGRRFVLELDDEPR